MSLPFEELNAIPADTARVARAAFPKGNLAMQLRDHLGTIYDNPLFAEIFSPLGAPAIDPWRLALVSVLQFAEGLSDRQASEAVRARIELIAGVSPSTSTAAKNTSYRFSQQGSSWASLRRRWRHLPSSSNSI